MATKKPVDLVVLNTIQAVAADIVLSGGKLQFNDGTNDLLRDPVILTDAVASQKIAYAAGTASVKTYDLTAVTLTASTAYRLAVVIDGRIDFASGAGKEADELIPIREYIVWFDSAPTADALKAAFIARINGDAQAAVTASSGGVGKVTLTLDSVVHGDFRVESPAGTVETVGTAYVAPAGTPAIVEALAPNASSATANYTTWRIDFDQRRHHNAVNGGQAMFREFIYVFADATAANYAAFETELDAVIAGSHTPVADYLGI